MGTVHSQASQLVDRALHYITLKPAVSSFILLHVSFGLAYIIVFQLTRIETLNQSAAGALINVVPMIMLNLAVIKLLQVLVLGKSTWAHMLIHPLFGTGYSFAWYFCVIVGRGIRSDWLEQGFSITPFGWVGGTWQLYQGLALYGIAALFAYAHYFYQRAIVAESALKTTPSQDKHSQTTTDRLVVKSEGEFIALDWQDIIFIEASGDEVVIHTKQCRMTTHRTMTSIARKMPSPPLARIHRSFIANIDQVLTAEPAGNGKLTLHMTDGISLTTSRAGAQTFKACVT